MATPLAAGQILATKLFCFEPNDKQVLINILHYRVTAIGGAGASDQDLAIQLSLVMAPRYKAIITPNIQYWGVSAQVIKPAVLSPVTASSGRAGGLAGSPPVPMVAAPVVTWRTGLAGRAFRGRSYIGGMSSTLFNPDGEVTPTGIGILGSWAGELLNFTNVNGVGGGDTATVELVLYHRLLGTASTITNFNVSGKVGRQKRRGSYGKLNNAPVL